VKATKSIFIKLLIETLSMYFPKKEPHWILKVVAAAVLLIWFSCQHIFLYRRTKENTIASYKNYRSSWSGGSHLSFQNPIFYPLCGKRNVSSCAAKSVSQIGSICFLFPAHCKPIIISLPQKESLVILAFSAFIEFPRISPR